MVDQADLRLTAPGRRKERHAVADLNDQVAVSQTPPVDHWRPEELAVGPATSDDVIGTIDRLAAAQQADLIAARHHAFSEAVYQHLGAAGPLVSQIAPRNEQEPPASRLRRRRIDCRIWLPRTAGRVRR